MQNTLDPSTQPNTDIPSDEVTPDTATAEATNTASTGTDAVSADTVLELESMIKQGMTTLDRNKTELKKLKEMLESALLNNEAYRDASEKAKEAAKTKGKAKANVMAEPANHSLAEKIKDLTQENKDLSIAQSEYLREYARLSGTNEIEGDDGEVREIVYVAKLVKKAKR